SNQLAGPRVRIFTGTASRHKRPEKVLTKHRLCERLRTWQRDTRLQRFRHGLVRLAFTYTCRRQVTRAISCGTHCIARIDTWDPRRRSNRSSGNWKSLRGNRGQHKMTREQLLEKALRELLATARNTVVAQERFDYWSQFQTNSATFQRA